MVSGEVTDYTSMVDCCKLKFMFRVKFVVANFSGVFRFSAILQKNFYLSKGLPA